MDAAVVVTDHAAVDYGFVVRQAPLVVDTRNAPRDVAEGREKIIEAQADGRAVRPLAPRPGNGISVLGPLGGLVNAGQDEESRLAENVEGAVGKPVGEAVALLLARGIGGEDAHVRVFIFVPG